MILMNDFNREPEILKSRILGASKKVIDSGWYVLGPEVESFEKLWANACNVKYGCGVANGMDAIEIILRCLKIGSGDEVITTPMTAIATVLAIVRTGATPVMADIDPETGIISIESVERCISSKTAAVVLVHLYGQILNMDEWVKLCDSHGIELIEDCAQSHLATDDNGNLAGSFGSAGAFSFYPTKNLGTFGDGGMIVTNNEEIGFQSKILRNYGQSVRYHHPEIGVNSRLDEIHAAILKEKLKFLDQFTDLRRRNAKYYYENIKSSSSFELLRKPDNFNSHVFHLFVIISKDRDVLQGFLKENKIETLIHYPIPVHYQKPFKNIKRDPLGLINSEVHASQCLSLPCHPFLYLDELEKIVSVLNRF